MRYSIYKYIRGLSESVIEAVEHMKSTPSSVSLIIDCVTAISMINESLVKNNMQLPEINDFLSMSEKIVEAVNDKLDYSASLSELLDISKKINLYCSQKINYKFKILFLAELGSKWDSLDSIYRAFSNREDCEVEVVIAPIYRAVKYPDGEIKSDVLYEDFLTPLGIKHTLFNNYDIKKDMPDITFTTQPYESVTSEQFWAENIAPYTHLVYVPYFTISQIDTEEKIYTNCQMPIHKLAWKVICQSEKAKELYSKYSPTKCENFIATGLPKWDWTVNMNERKIEFPKEWEKLKNKKNMLCNVHYTFPTMFEDSLCNYRDLMKKYSDNKGIIFRFHPMTNTMFKLYYPQYKDEWERFLSEVENSKNAVIDTNISYDYAFKFSDFLYSSPSSMIYQYAITKKPLAIFYDALEMCQYLIKDYELGRIEEASELYKLFEKLYNGMDENREKRLAAIEEGMPNLDGKIGYRLSEYLINELLSEENIK